MKNSVPLTTEAKKLKKELVAEYGIHDAAGVLLVRTVCECFDEMRRAQRVIATEGQLRENRFGEQKPHPAVSIVKDARAHMMLALKGLNLDLEPLRDLGRPPGS